MNKYAGHTPEPWRLNPRNGRIVEDAEGRKVATASDRPNKPEAWANAALCIAAPMLLRQRNALLEAAKVMRGRIHENEGGVPRYYTTNGAAMNAAVVLLDKAIAACEADETK